MISSKRAGVGHNRSYRDGFNIERAALVKFRATYMKALGADKLTEATRGPLDTVAGIDALATIQGQLYPVSLRHRKRDYQSITLSRHRSEEASEARKWLDSPRGAMKPYYHITTAELGSGRYRLILVNVEGLAEWLRSIDLGKYWRGHLAAYEIPLEAIPDGIGVKHWEVF